MEDLKYGLITLPVGMPVSDFIFGKATGKDKDADCVPDIPIVMLSGLIEEYSKLSGPPAKTQSNWKTEQIHLRHLQRFAKTQGNENPLVDTISVAFFNHYKAFRKNEGVRTDTVTRELTTFSCMFQVAVDHRYIPHNIVRDVKRDRSEVPCERFRTHSEIQEIIAIGGYSKKEIKEFKRFRYLTVQEIERLLSLAEGKWIYPELVTYAYTGMRKGELPRLQWADVDMEKGFLVVRSYKQSKRRKESSRNVPIHKRLKPVIEEQKRKTGKLRWVFCGPNNSQLKSTTLQTTFSRLLKGSEFEGVGFHVFRHSLISHLAAKGVDQREIDEIVGHQTEEMRRRYCHLFPSNLKNAMKKLGAM